MHARSRRYFCLIVLMAFTVLFTMSVEWNRFAHWIPEQYWSLLLLVTLYLYINPFYAWLVFWDGPTDNWVHDMLEVLEYDFKIFGSVVTRAFEIVLVSSCQGVQTFIFRYAHQTRACRLSATPPNPRPRGGGGGLGGVGTGPHAGAGSGV